MTKLALGLTAMSLPELLAHLQEVQAEVEKRQKAQMIQRALLLDALLKNILDLLRPQVNKRHTQELTASLRLVPALYQDMAKGDSYLKRAMNWLAEELRCSLDINLSQNQYWTDLGGLTVLLTFRREEPNTVISLADLQRAAAAIQGALPDLVR